MAEELFVVVIITNKTIYWTFVHFRPIFYKRSDIDVSVTPRFVLACHRFQWAFPTYKMTVNKNLTKKPSEELNVFWNVYNAAKYRNSSLFPTLSPSCHQNHTNPGLWFPPTRRVAPQGGQVNPKILLTVSKATCFYAFCQVTSAARHVRHFDHKLWGAQDFCQLN